METKKQAAAAGGLRAALVRLNHLAHRLMLLAAQLSILAMIVIVTLTSPHSDAHGFLSGIHRADTPSSYIRAFLSGQLR